MNKEELANRYSSALAGRIKREWFVVEENESTYTFTFTVAQHNRFPWLQNVLFGIIAAHLRKFFPGEFPSDTEIQVFCVGESDDPTIVNYVVNTDKIEVIYCEPLEEMEKLFSFLKK